MISINYVSSSKRLLRSQYYTVLIVLFLLVIYAIINSVSHDNFIDNVLRGLLFLLASSTLISSRNRYAIGTISFLIIYGLIYTINSFANGFVLRDVINSQTFLIYFILFQIFVSQKFEYLPLNWPVLCKFLLLIVIITYLNKYFISSVQSPFLFVENNFEILLILILWISLILNNHLRLFSWLSLGIFSAILFSNSLSGQLLLLYLMAFRTYRIWKIVVFIFGGLVVIYTTADFYTGLDRYLFLTEFTRGIGQNSCFSNMLPMSIRELAPSARRTLHYYTGSSQDPHGIYLAKSLHMWILSSLYNHGLFIFIFIKMVFNTLKSRIGRSNAFLITGAALINGLSVSAFDSIWYWTALILILPLWQNSKRGEIFINRI